MLLRFSVSNWMSFRDEAILDMTATREKQHSEHLATVPKYEVRVLPVAAIYGGNASGKSNLVKALQFAKNFVLSPPRPGAPIGAKPFLLNEISKNRKTGFRFEIMIAGSIFEYSFSIDAKEVNAEELVRVSPGSEERLFRRSSDPAEFTLYDKAKDKDALEFAFRGTQENQLFLTNSVSQRLAEFRPIFSWFRDDLTVIDPSTYFAGLLAYAREEHPRFLQMSQKLHELDCGVEFLKETEVLPTSVLPKELVDSLSVDLTEHEPLPLASIGGEEGVFLELKDGKPVARRLIPFHRDEGGRMVPFQYLDESDGTRRLLDILPAFLMLGDERYSTTFVIDELDRSLHPNLTRNLVETFLACRRESSRTQLVFTTHDAQLMTQEIFRRDELWAAERDQSGASKLIAFSEFKDVRKDRDIRKSYLQGRMGGVPHIRGTNSQCSEEVEAR